MANEAHALISTTPQPIITAERELDWEDLDKLPERETQAVGGQRIQNIRQIHHKVARMMAAGCANVEIAACTALSPGRIGGLRNDPAFQELLAYYEDSEWETWKEVREKAAMLGLTAAEVMQERIMERPDSISTKDLMEVMKAGMDYGGHKPAARSENFHVHTAADRIEKAKEGRQENVSVRSGPDGEFDDGSNIYEGEIVEEEESRNSVREEGADGDSEAAGDADAESLD